MTKPTNETGIVGQSVLQTLPAGAQAFQAAVDGKLTTDVWSEILDAQIQKAKEGDRGAAKFLLEYAGGVASMRGATFVQEIHNHEHYHADGDVVKAHTPPPISGTVPRSQPGRTPDEYEQSRERHAQTVRSRLSEAGGR